MTPYTIWEGKCPSCGQILVVPGTGEFTLKCKGCGAVVARRRAKGETFREDLKHLQELTAAIASTVDEEHKRSHVDPDEGLAPKVRAQVAADVQRRLALRANEPEAAAFRCEALGLAYSFATALESILSALEVNERGGTITEALGAIRGERAREADPAGQDPADP